MSKKIVTINFEVPEDNVPSLQEMERDGALDDLAECVALMVDGRAVGVVFSD